MTADLERMAVELLPGEEPKAGGKGRGRGKQEDDRPLQERLAETWQGKVHIHETLENGQCKAESGKQWQKTRVSSNSFK